MEKPMRHFFVEAPLEAGQTLHLPHALHRRLTRVLRRKDGEVIALFNNRDGCFRATLADNGQTAQVGEQLAPHAPTSALSLLVGLPKKDAMDRVIRQATELGVATIQPLLTDFCVPNRLNLPRAQDLLIEAAEQCERTDLPALTAPSPLQEAIAAYPHPVYWCRERTGETWPASTDQPCALLVGPEGGFSPGEMDWLSQQAHVREVSLGSTILRVDTAVAAGLGRLLATTQPIQPNT
jgi:16S rRNA (uracil1498-N3)-methyltransferase